jgi:valyl-tRNA synthetase
MYLLERRVKKLKIFDIFSFQSQQYLARSPQIVVSTTRLETMLGDVAVAVHPADPRYTKFHARKLAHPFIAGRELKIVCDAEV